MNKWINNGLYKLSKYIKENVQLAEYLVTYEGMTFKKYGSNIRAVCPLHHDTDPSFTIDTSKNVYYCFGCKSGGTVINFVEQKYDINRIQALRQIAANAGINISEYIDEIPEKFVNIMECAHQFFLSKTDTKAYVDFFANKSFKNSANKYIGFSTTETELKEYLISKGYSEQDIWTFSLYGEKFNNSIIYPIRDSFGFINQFSCRTFTDTKYVKTDENTPMFIPHLLLGVDTLKSGDECVIVEGNNDYYALRDTYNVVAMLGTKFNQSMIDMLLSFDVTKIIFWVDGDNGGWSFIKSMYDNYANLFCKNGLIAEVVFIPGKDPDEVLHYETSVPLINFVLDSKYNTNNKQSFIKTAIKNGAGYDALTVESTIKYLAQKTEYAQDKINDAFIEKFSKENSVDPLAERMILSIFLENPKLLHEENVSCELFGVSAHRQIFECMISGQTIKMLIKNNVPDWVARVVDDLPIPDMSAFSDIIMLLKSLSDKRFITNIAKTVINHDLSVDDSIMKLSDGIAKFYQGDKFKLIDIGMSIKGVIDKIITGETEIGISFGKNWPTLNKILFGLCNHRLILLSGNTGHGKTTLALNWIYNISIDNAYKGIMFSGEMPHEEITQRLIAMGSGVSTEKMITGQVNDSDLQKIYDVAAKVDAKNLYINGTMDFDKIISAIKFAKIKHGINYVVIDYLQLIEPPKRFLSMQRSSQLKEMSRILKTRICEELDLPVILLAQLGDQALDDATPTARRMSESKLVQSDCDVTLAMRRKTDKEMELDSNGDIYLYIDKVRYNRGGVMVAVDHSGDMCFMSENVKKY